MTASRTDTDLQVTPDVAIEPEPAAVEEFAGQLIGVLNHGMLALMISVGHRTGLFDAMSTMAPADSATIAASAGVNERYVREWLGAMTTGQIVDYDAKAGTYHLPPERAAMLTRAAGPNNLAAFAQFIAMLGKVETGIVDSFREGGGVPYSEYPEFQKLMAEDSAMVFDATLVDVTIPLVPGLVERLQAGIDVADIGCGSEHAINLLAESFPNSRFTGYDFSEEGIAVGTAEDDQAHPKQMLKGIHDMLRPGGTYLCVDVGASSHLHDNLEHPLGTFLYTVSCMHCMTVSLALGGDGLGAVWGEELALEMLKEAGFSDIDVQRVEGDILNNYYIAHRD